MDDTDVTRLFVYGTLRRGAPMHALIASDARLVGPATLAGRIYDLGAYPAFSDRESKRDVVRGELRSGAGGTRSAARQPRSLRGSVLRARAPQRDLRRWEHGPGLRLSVSRQARFGAAGPLGRLPGRELSPAPPSRALPEVFVVARQSSSPISSSRVTPPPARAPSPRAASARPRLCSWSARMRSSTVSRATSRYTKTGRSWPIRCARSAA